MGELFTHKGVNWHLLHGNHWMSESTKFSGCLNMVVYFHSSFSQHMLKYTVACFPQAWQTLPSCENERLSIKKSSFQTPIIQNHHINICLPSTLPPWSNTSACHFPAVLSQTQFKTGGKTDPGSLLTSRHVFKCISAVPRHHGSQKTSTLGALVKIPQMPTLNNERWPSPQRFSTNSPLCWIPTSCDPLCENRLGIYTRAALLAITAARGPHSSIEPWHSAVCT